jgi:RNA-directed DNA polymerase
MRPFETDCHCRLPHDALLLTGEDHTSNCFKEKLRHNQIFRRYQSQPIARMIQLMNPILRGWGRYFAVGDASRCFGFVKDWVEKKVRRHLMRARKRKGFGWKRWSRQWLYKHLGLFKDYRVQRPRQMPKVLPAR